MTITMLMITALMQATPMPIPQAHNETPVTPLPGQRQTPDDATPNVTPMNRLSTRIENRIAARTQNRIARSQPGTTTIYKTATDQSRRAR